MNKSNFKHQKKAEEMQANIFIICRLVKKVRLTSKFFELGQELNKKYGTRRLIKKNS